MAPTDMSPIERMLWAELEPLISKRGWEFHRGHRIGPYYPDGLVLCTTKRGTVALIVECDGHDFHDRTKEQAAHDRRRDRFFLFAAGAPTARFTGSEIHQSPLDCAHEVVAAFESLIRERMTPTPRGTRKA